MKLLRASREVGVIERIRSALQSAGIECTVRNEMTAFLAGEVPFPDCTPEVWVVDDEQLREAQQIVAALEREPATAGSSWTCSGCGEIVEAQFDSCWRCGSQRG